MDNRKRKSKTVKIDLKRKVRTKREKQSKAKMKWTTNLSQETRQEGLKMETLQLRRKISGPKDYVCVG